MWVEITAGTSIKGVPVNPGDIEEVDDASARTLIHYKLAEPASGDAIKKAVAKRAVMKKTADKAEAERIEAGRIEAGKTAQNNKPRK